MKISKQIYIIFILSLVLLLSSVALFSWMFITTRSIASDTAALAQEIHALEQKDSTVRIAESLLSGSKGSYDKLNKLFIQKGNVSEVLQHLELIGGYSNTTVTVRSIKEKEGSAKKKKKSFGKMQSITIQLALSGKFKDVMKFLSLLDTVPYVVTLNTVHMTRKAENLLWSASLTIEVLAEKEK